MKNFLQFGYLTKTLTDEDVINEMKQSGKYNVHTVKINVRDWMGKLEVVERLLFVPKEWLEKYPPLENEISNLYTIDYLKAVENEFREMFPPIDDMDIYLGHWKV